MNDALQKLRVLSRAEIMLVKIHLQVLAKQTVLCAAALLVAILALLAVNAAIYLFLVESLDRSVAALIVAAINVGVAALLFAMALRTEPGPEAPVAEQFRDLALSELQADAEAIRQNVKQVGTDVQRIRSGFGGLGGGGGSLRGLMQLTPLLDLLTSTLKRSRKK